MATEDSVKNIKDQVTCSICLDLFRDPVTTDCGHSFCKECIAQYCEEEDIDIACPLCKKKFQKRNLRINRELRNIMESLPQFLRSQTGEKLVEGNLCKRHQEPLKFYCKEDQISICVVCEKSKAHRTHTVIPMEEAVQEYREKLAEQLEEIESTFQKLSLLDDKVCERLPWSAREKIHQRLKKLTDKAAIPSKGDIESRWRRFEDPTSQTPQSELESFLLGMPIAVEAELQGQKERENISDQVAEKQETGSHVISICEKAPTPKYGLDQASLDPVIHNIHNTTKDTEYKVDVKGSKERSEDLTSLKAAEESGERRKDSASPGRNVATRTELPEHEEKGGEALMEQKETKTDVCEEAKIPRSVARRKHQGVRYSTLGVIRELKQVEGKPLRQSRSRSVDSGGRRKGSISPGGNVAVLTELPAREEKEKKMSSNGKKAAIYKHTSIRSQHSRIPIMAHKQVDGKPLRGRFEDSMSLKPSVESERRRKDSISPGGNVAMMTELLGNEEKEKKMSSNGKKAAIYKHTSIRSQHSRIPIMAHKQVNLKGSKEKSEDLTSLKAAVESGERRKDSASPGRNAATGLSDKGKKEKKKKNGEKNT